MSGIRPTEMTIRDLLQEELRQRGVIVIPEFSVSTSVWRLMPDMLLKNGAQYVVETKLGADAKRLDTAASCWIVYIRLNKLKIRFKIIAIHPHRCYGATLNRRK